MLVLLVPVHHLLLATVPRAPCPVHPLHRSSSFSSSSTMDELFDDGPVDDGGVYADAPSDNYEDEEITQEDAWVVIDQYFWEKGLVGQQIDSFDEFIRYTIQELVNDTGEISVTPEDQFVVGQFEVEQYTYVVKFRDIYVTPPAVFEADGKVCALYPQEARLRSLTYQSPVYVDIQTKQYQLDENRKYKPDDEPVKSKELPRILLAYIPMMLRSNHCALKGRSDRDLTKIGECVFDQGGYFVINGSEKVMIAQERMSNNHVYVFKKQQPSKYEWVCETRSHVPQGARPTSTMYLLMYGSGNKGSIDGHHIRCNMPYIRAEIPIVVVFRALGFISDKDILRHVVYDFADREMMDHFKPSLDEAVPIKHQNVALDYIGKRGSTVNVGRKERIQYAREILQKELLPHVGTEENNETKKTFFIGYIVHKMLMCSLGRQEEDDRDHFGKKRLDLAGPLMGGLFRMLFKKLTIEVKKYLQKSLEEGRDFNVAVAMKGCKIVSDGMKVGEWGARACVWGS